MDKKLYKDCKGHYDAEMGITTRCYSSCCCGSKSVDSPVIKDCIVKGEWRVLIGDHCVKLSIEKKQ